MKVTESLGGSKKEKNKEYEYKKGRDTTAKETINKLISNYTTTNVPKQETKTNPDNLANFEDKKPKEIKTQNNDFTNNDLTKPLLESKNISKEDFDKQVKSIGQKLEDNKKRKAYANTRDNTNFNINVELSQDERYQMIQDKFVTNPDSLTDEEKTYILDINNRLSTDVRQKNAQTETMNLQQLDKEQGLAQEDKDIINQWGAFVDDEGNVADANAFSNEVDLYNQTAENINKEIEKLNNRYTKGEISREELEIEYNALKQKWDENDAIGQRLSKYQVKQGFDWYDWAKEKGVDVTDFEKYVSSMNDPYIQNLGKLYEASLIDIANTPVQAYEILKTFVTRNAEDKFDFTGEDSLSTKMTNTANELRTYAMAGTGGATEWSLQCLSSLMPMVNATLMGIATGGALGVSNVTDFASAFTNVTLGAQNAGQVTRQRIEEGNDLASAISNGIVHGVITGLVEGMNAGDIASIFTGDAEKFLLSTSLMGKADFWRIAGYLNAIGVSEGTEEIVESVADYITDNVQNIIIDMQGGAKQKIDSGMLDANEMVNEFVMAYAGALLLGAKTAINVTIDTKAKYNSALQARAYFESVINSPLSSIEEIEMARSAIATIDYDINGYVSKSPLSDAVEFADEQASPMPSYNRALNNLANAIRQDVQGELATAQETLDRAEALQSQFQTSLIERGIDFGADEYLQLNERARKKFITDAMNINKAFKNSRYIAYSTNVTDEEGNPVNAKIDMATGKILINVSTNADTPAVISTLHEVIHSIENTQEWHGILNQVFKGDGTLLNKINDLGGKGGRYEGESLDTLKSEAVAIALTEDVMNENTANAVLEHLAKYNTSVAYKLLYKFEQITGLFKDNSTIGRVTSLLTDALDKQETKYTRDGVAYLRPIKVNGEDLYSSYAQLSEIVDNPVSGLSNGKTLYTPYLRTGKYHWQKLGDNNATFLMQREAISGLITGTKQIGHTYHQKANVAIIKNLDYLIDNPLAVYESHTRPGAYTLILDARDDRGYPIVLSINPSDKAPTKVSFIDEKGIPSASYVSLGTGIYGKDAFKVETDKVGNRKLTKEGETNFKNFFEGFDRDNASLVYSAYGNEKSDVMNAVRRLLLSTFEVPSLNVSISSLLEKTNQLVLLEQTNGIYLDPTHTKTFEEIKNDRKFLEESGMLSDDFEIVDSTKYITIYSNSPIKDGSKINFNSGKYSQSVATDTLLWDNNDNVYYLPTTDKHLDDENYATNKGFSINETNRLKDAYIKAGKDEAKKVESEIKSNIYSNLDRRFPDRFNNKAMRDFKNQFDYQVSILQMGKYDNMSDEQLGIEINKAVDEWKKNVLKLKKGDSIRLEDITNDRRTMYLMALIEKLGDRITPLEYSEELEIELGGKYIDMYVNGEGNKALPDGARKVKPGEIPRLDILVGPAGAGKSFAFADSIISKYGSIDFDTDHGKELFDPGFKLYGGIATPYTGATGRVVETLQDTYLNKKEYNLLVQGTGKTTSNILELIDKGLRLGYDVYLWDAETSSRISIESAIERGLKQRITPYNFMVSAVADNPSKTYDLLKNYSIDIKNEDGTITTRGVTGYGQDYRYEFKKSTKLERGGETKYSRISKESGTQEGNRNVEPTSPRIEGEGDDGRRDSFRVDSLLEERNQLSDKATNDIRGIYEEGVRELNQSGWRERGNKIDETLRRRYANVLQRELERRGYNYSNDDGRLENTGDFNIKKVNGETFHDIFTTARLITSKGELVDVHPINTDEDWTGYNDCTNYLASDGLSGFSITKNGDLISVFNASGKKGFLRSIAPFIRENAKTLDCYVLDSSFTGTNLQELYEKRFGFKTKDVVDYNWDYDHDSIGVNYNTPKIAYMYNPEIKETKYSKTTKTHEQNVNDMWYGSKQRSNTNVDTNETDVNVDTQSSSNVQRFASSNIPKSGVFSKAQKETVRQKIADGEFTYVGLSNKEEVNKALAKYKKLGKTKSYDNFMNNQSPTAQSVIEGEILVAKLAKANDPRWEDVSVKLADDATIIGQALQAYSIMQRLTPNGQLKAIERNMNKMQQNLVNRFGERNAPHLEINDELRERLIKAKDVESLIEAREAIYKDLTEQVPKTIGDTLDSWRYLAMLGNPRTHIRNFVGNGIFVPIVDMKDAVGAVLERTLGKALGVKENTKALGFGLSSRLLGDAETKRLIAEGEKAYEAYKGAIENEQKYERKDFTEHTFVGKGLNKASEFNSTLLDKEDFIFSKDRFARAYAQYMKANNLTPETITDKQKVVASNVALLEAQKATYRDANALAEWLNELEYSNKKGLRLASFAKKAVIPFTKTPMNIIKRGVEYSPVGLTKTLTYGAKQLSDGKINANQFIDNLASGLTGSALTGLGWFLARAGIFRTKDEDKKRKQYFDEENGEQDYSIDLSPFGINGTYTIDWATPVIMPLSMGANISSFFDDLDGIDGFKSGINAVADIVARIADPVVETTMLSGLKDVMTSFANSDGEWFGDMVMSAFSSYIGQMFPTLGGQIARTIDDVRRTTYPNDGGFDKTYKQILNKIPGLSKLNEPYINRKGEIEKNVGDKWWKRAILNFFSPGYYAEKDLDKYGEEMYRLLESTGDDNALPSNSSANVTYDKETYKFTDKQYTEWQKVRWSSETKYVNKFIDSAEYKNLSDDERVAVIKDIRSYAQLIAKKDFLDSIGTDKTTESYEELVKKIDKVSGAESNGIDIHKYFDYENNSGSKQADKIAYLEDSGMSKKQKEYLYNLSGYKTSYSDAYSKIVKKGKTTPSKSSSSSKGNSSSSSKITFKSNLVSSSSKLPIVNKYKQTYSNVLKKNSTAKSTDSNITTCGKCGNKVNPVNGRCPVCGNNL